MDNPGSPEAVKKGCRCSPTNNHNGKGFRPGGRGEPIFWKEENCPLHGPEAEMNKQLKEEENEQ